MSRLLVLVLALAACDSGPSNWQPLRCPPDPGVQSANIQWVRTADPKATCALLSADTFDRGACIQCLIVDTRANCVLHAAAPQVIDDVILGHEVKHAFGCKHE